MITVKLKTNLIDKNRIHRGKKHNYLDLVLIENKFGRDEFGYDGFVKQGTSKEEREANPDLQLPIIGNYTIYTPRAQASEPASAVAPVSRTPAPLRAATTEVPNMADEDCPF
jgi:hypothetical protein